MAQNAIKTFHITGRVIDRTTGQGSPGLRVEGWDKDLICDDLIGSATTDAEGRFHVEFTESYFKELFLDREPDLFFKVFRGDELIKSTEDSVLWNVRAGETEVVIEVDIPAVAKPEKPFVVQGEVRDADGNPVAGAIVRAYDRDLRSEEPLGEPTSTDKDGHYAICYSADQFRRAEKVSADIVVKAIAADGSLLAASPVLFNAPPSADVDLTIPAEKIQPPTLFEKIGRALAAPLGGLKAEELEEDKEHQDLSFLSGETGIEKQTVARFVVAHKLAQHGLQPEFWFALLDGSFYEYSEDRSLEEQVSTILDALSALDAAAVRKALIRGLNQKEVPEAFRESVARWVEAFLKFMACRSVGGGDKPTFVKLALDDAKITGATKQETFARLFNEYKAFRGDLDAQPTVDEFATKGSAVAGARKLVTVWRKSKLTKPDYSPSEHSPGKQPRFRNTCTVCLHNRLWWRPL